MIETSWAIVLVGLLIWFTMQRGIAEIVKAVQALKTPSFDLEAAFAKLQGIEKKVDTHGKVLEQQARYMIAAILAGSLDEPKTERSIFDRTIFTPYREILFRLEADGGPPQPLDLTRA